MHSRVPDGRQRGMAAVPCGFPANATDIELRMQQGFSVFVMNWGEAGFKAVSIGRAAAAR